jgi:2-hydroxychromene-2-carboxylate isomerase
MKHLRFWFDPVSPYAYLAFERLPHAFQGLTYSVDYQPVLLSAMLSHWGQKWPVEIEPKRAWVFRQVHWLAHRYGIELQTPARHPYNPLALLRLAWACAPEGRTPNRHVCEQILRHTWCGGADAEDPQRMSELIARLAPTQDPQSPAVKQLLRIASDDAVARGVFGVPTLEVDDRLFWGLDALDMVAAYLRGDPWFDGPAWQDAGVAPPGLQRTR